MKGPRAVLGRLGWGVGDQAVSSLTNLVVGLAVARVGTPTQFGAFSIAFATYLICLNASRGLATDALLVRFAIGSARDRRAASSSATGSALVMGIGLGAGVVLIGLFLPGPVGATLVTLGLVLPGLLVQDSWRFVFFADGRPGRALVNDTVWGLTAVLLLLGLHRTEVTEPAAYLAVWGSGATLAAVVGAVQTRILPRPDRLLAWWTTTRDLSPRYLAENLSTSGGTQLRAYALGAIAGLGAVGALRAADLLLGPIYVLVTGMGVMAVAEAARARRRSLRRFWQLCLTVAGLGVAATLGWGGLLLLAPDPVGRALLGASWPAASALLVPTVLAFTGSSAMVGAWAGLRALGAARRSLRTQALASALYLAASLVGAVVAAAPGTAWGSAAATIVGAALWWWQLRRAVTENAGHPRSDLASGRVDQG